MLGVMDSPKQSSMGEPKVDCIARSTLEHWREVQHLRLQTFPTLRSHLQIPTRWMKPSNEWLKPVADPETSRGGGGGRIR